MNRRRPRPAAALLVLSLGLLWAAPVAAQTDPGTVIQTIDAWRWSPPSTDTAGITYRPDTGELISCDSEVDETVDGITFYAGVNLWTHTRTGLVTGTATTVPWSNEPTGIAWDPAGGRLWTSDDDQKRIYQIDFGADHAWNTADDVRKSLRGYDTGDCDDLEDVAYNPLTGQLYVSSGSSEAICTISPGPNGVFNGAGSFGDDVVTTFSIAAYGISDVEGVVYDPFWNTLVLADRGTRDLYELTPQGAYLRKIDVNFPSNARVSGITIAPGSTNPLLRNYWVTDRRTDNNTNPNANDGRIYEVVAIPLGGNGPPIVEAGPPRTLQWPENSLTLDGFVSDDGHPYPPSVVASLWSKLSGPGSVTFGSASSPSTTATFSTPGSYVLQLEGDDSLAQTVDTVSVLLDTTVTLSSTVVGPGSLALDPPGGSYTYGQSVTVSAAPEPNARFAGWSGDLSGDVSPQPLMMDGSKAVTATFEALYQVTVEATGPGSVTLDPPGGSYPAGTVVTVTATPGPNAVFDGFGGALSGTASPQPLTVNGDEAISASFTQHYTLAVTTSGPGSLTLDPATGPYAPGTTVTVTAVPDPDAAFTGFSGDLAGTTSPQPIVMNDDRSVSASFAALYDVSVDATGPGSVTLSPPGGSYPAGSVVTVTAAPDPNAVFDGFTGDLAGTESPQLLTVDGDKTIGASFTQRYSVSASSTGPGSVTLDPPTGPYAPGSVVTVTATPDAGAVFDGFTGDLAGTESPQLLTVDGNKTIGASFTQRYSVSASSTGPGSVTLDPPGGSYPAGSVVTLTATPGPNAMFDGFGGALSGTESPQQLTVSADATITASFTQLYTVSAGSTGPGSVTLDPPTGPYAPGSVVTVAATPDAGAVFDGFTGDLAGTESPQLLTVDGDKTVSASFSAVSYSLHTSVRGGGAISVDPPDEAYPAGSIVTLTAVPTSGNYVFEYWSGDATGSTNPLLLAMDGDKTVRANFASTGTSGGGGSACGIGPELAAALPLLGWLHRRRRRQG